jgi:hypothetical protein
MKTNAKHDNCARTPNPAPEASPARCLLYANYSPSPRACQACRTVAMCPYYDPAGSHSAGRQTLARWEYDGGTHHPSGERNEPARRSPM